MPGNSFGQIFRITSWGESHGGGVGVVIDGCPPRIALSPQDIQPDLDRRRPGQSSIVTPRKEADACQILSGVFRGKTLGTPILIWVPNTDARPDAYREMETMYRPSHADFTYQAKYGIRNWEGGGRSSARETIARVAAAAVAKRVLGHLAPGLEVIAWVGQVHRIAVDVDPLKVTPPQVERTPVRCPDPKAANRMIRLIESARADGDSLGGIVECVIRGAPAGLGEPVFDRFEADLAKAMLSLPATKGFEIGSGFEGTRMRGSEHNDPFVMRAGKVHTASNRSGGTQGGITNGEPVLFRIAFKPTATIAKPQKTVTTRGHAAILRARGRHDPCVLPRAVPIVEAMTWLVLIDHWLRQRAQCGSRPRRTRSSR
ncbi:MAG: chorismate synthase [Verrucomicrobiae bacterium]|nr:chorismate synthase [Verrucomicrobiae bacterium]